MTGIVMTKKQMTSYRLRVLAKANPMDVHWTNGRLGLVLNYNNLAKYKDEGMSKYLAKRDAAMADIERGRGR